MHYRTHTHTSHQGYVLILSLVFLGIFSALATAYLSYTTISSRSVQHSTESAQALALAEAGIDKAIARLNQDGSYTGESNTTLAPGAFTVTVSTIDTTTRKITATGFVPDSINPRASKTVHADIAINTSTISFHYGVQVGEGGVTMNNGSQIIGNIFSNGDISGSGTITGDATAASGAQPHAITGVTVQGTARAHTLSSCTVGGDAFYQSISDCTVGGTAHPGSSDTLAVAMPIEDSQISEWEALAESGGVINGPYTINGSQTIGPKKIDGNLTVKGMLTLSGVLWVKGNIIFENNSKLSVSAITGNEGAIIVADVPGSESTKGAVTLSNNMVVSGNGNPGSFPMILSTNSSSNAIEMSNNSNSVILYASRGTVSVSNNAGANAVTAHHLLLGNNTTITYISGLQSQNFSNGPGGSWAFVPGTYSISP